MLKPVVSFDADMTAGQALERLAACGFRSRGTTAREEAVKRLARDPAAYGAAIRRQWGTRVLWYARELREVLDRCTRASADESLLDVMQLSEADAIAVIRLKDEELTILPSGVVMDGDEPVAVSLGVAAPIPRMESVPRAPPVFRGPRIKGAESYGLDQPREVPAWPSIEAPDFVPALERFDVVVGFAASPQAGVSGGEMILRAPPGVQMIEVTVELSAGTGVEAIEGWSRTMSVSLDDVASAKVRFVLVGKETADAWHPLLTNLEVRYVVAGTVCGTASRPLIVLHSRESKPPPQGDAGEAWSAASRASGPVDLTPDEHAPDLTIEITKSDRNASSGQYECQLFSPHELVCERGPFPMALGQDAKTFAGAIVDEVRTYAGSPMLVATLEGIGRLVAQCLPSAVFDALHEVSAKVSPAVPAVLIVSAEPYVPWELAWMDQPLDPARPGYLGCQALVGRWLRNNDPVRLVSGVAQASRPAVRPISDLSVRHMAVMAAWYRAPGGLQMLPNAEAEARSIVSEHGALPLAATAQAMQQFLYAKLENGFDIIGGVEAAHFAGHGDFDSTRPDASSLFLSDNTPIRSNQFRAASYGGAQQPLMFLNACMLGIGGELLGDMGGFPGSSLRGGFGGLLGALWEIDDEVACAVALEFWQRALPPAPAKGEPVGEILRDLRCRLMSATHEITSSTYLAYVYYGHPRLRLERAS